MINKAGNMIRLVRIFPLKMIFKSLYRSGFCEFFGFSRWSDISPDFKVWSTHCAKLGKSSGSSWSSSASFSLCSRALSTLLNKMDLMRKSGKTKFLCLKKNKHFFCTHRKFYDCILWSALTVTTVGYNLQPEVEILKNDQLLNIPFSIQYVFDLLLEQDACPTYNFHSVRHGWDDERHVRHLWRLHHHLSDSPHGRHIFSAV